MGTDMLIPTSFALDDLPTVSTTDRILTNGSMVLYDPIHSSDPMESGLVEGQVVPNIAWREASDVLGAGDSASLAGSFEHGAGNTSGAILTERSGLGGLHVIMSQVGQNVNTQGAYISLAGDIQAYILANKDNNFYVSRWIERTRLAPSDGPSEGAIYGAGVGVTSSMLYNILPQLLQGTHANSTLEPNSWTGLEANLLTFETSQWSGSDPSGINVNGHPVAWGQTIGSYTSAAFNNKSSSYVLRRFYIEDLTVSGRSYSDVRAIDQGFWEQDHSAGGRWFGDTWSDPDVALP